ncbi:hypothetical protein DUNSADRAFT_9342 [Dunaliella salina]|uniref:Encoded protein n=1 Tax=Dunaliella salina TaxID=3046 RepID=A0ABQ7H5G8_DUNSA|nr:hypothetical protein DUNSADRAFT_9342 [Dunaliella salina]|eukprot:KAF5842083.1 hypothetical protein DUNSADRAFT_9342 [Dunaliella salina]
MQKLACTRPPWTTPCNRDTLNGMFHSISGSISAVTVLLGKHFVWTTSRYNMWTRTIDVVHLSRSQCALLQGKKDCR